MNTPSLSYYVNSGVPGQIFEGYAQASLPLTVGRWYLFPSDIVESHERLTDLGVTAAVTTIPHPNPPLVSRSRRQDTKHPSKGSIRKPLLMADPVVAPIAQHAGVVAYLLDAKVWVNRRVETLVLLDDKTIRRSVSVDFTLPDLASALGHAAPLATRPVPLGRLRRGFYTISVWSMRPGARCPFLTTEQTACIGMSILFNQARKALAERHGMMTIPPRLRRRLRTNFFEILRGDLASTQRALESLGSRSPSYEMKDSKSKRPTQNLPEP